MNVGTENLASSGMDVGTENLASSGMDVGTENLASVSYTHLRAHETG